MSKAGSWIVALSFGALVGLVLPLSVYLGNASAYAFGVGRLVGEGALFAAFLALAAFTLMRVSRRFAAVVAAFFVALLVCGYLESSLFAFGLPELNGELPASLDDAVRKSWDRVVWIGVVLAFVLCGRKWRGYLPLIALVALLMGIASVFDMQRDEATLAADDRRGGYELSVDIINNLAYSPTRNVMLLVLDNVDTFLAAELVERDRALRSKFPGFVAFRNNVGMHDSTKLGVPGMMTGEYFKPGRGALAKYIMAVFGSDSCLDTYKTHGDAIYSMFCTCSYGYTTADIPADQRRVQAEAKGPVAWRKTAEVPYLCLNDAVLFRTLPFVFKRQFLSTKLRHRDTVWSVDQTYDHEQTVYPVLAGRPVSDDPRQAFLKIHTHGGHPPYLFGADDYRSAVSNSLARLGTLFECWREKGIYDRSLIVVASDHGAVEAARSGEPLKCAAMLWVKGEGETAEWSISDEPTSHAKIAPLMKAASARTFDRAAVAEALKTENRFYRQRDRKDRHGAVDWMISPERKARRRE